MDGCNVAAWCVMEEDGMRERRGRAALEDVAMHTHEKRAILWVLRDGSTDPTWTPSEHILMLEEEERIVLRVHPHGQVKRPKMDETRSLDPRKGDALLQGSRANHNCLHRTRMSHGEKDRAG